MSIACCRSRVRTLKRVRLLVFRSRRALLNLKIQLTQGLGDAISP
jgi:hypothetical protein